MLKGEPTATTRARARARASERGSNRHSSWCGAKANPVIGLGSWLGLCAKPAEEEEVVEEEGVQPMIWTGVERARRTQGTCVYVGLGLGMV